ncbi:MAG TPA: hypothetical protein VKU01_13490 [Bryobacteraceae bacterium]|nr:hypothetical protein [Bryobacteraceae bacterium]
MRNLARGFVLLLALATYPAKAEIVDSSAGGFTVRTTVNIQAQPDEVYRRPEHTFSHNAHNLSIEDKPAGCFCEKLPNGGGVRHMEVFVAMPGKALVMHGGMGPLLSKATTGGMEIQLSPAEGGTKLEVIYAVAGYLPAGLNTWAAPFDNVVKEQFTRLKNFVEHGNPAPKEERR